MFTECVHCVHVYLAIGIYGYVQPCTIDVNVGLVRSNWFIVYRIMFTMQSSNMSFLSVCVQFQFILVLRCESIVNHYKKSVIALRLRSPVVENRYTHVRCLT